MIISFACICVYGKIVNLARKGNRGLEKGLAGAASGKANTGYEQEHNPSVLEAYYKRTRDIAQILLK